MIVLTSISCPKQTMLWEQTLTFSVNLRKHEDLWKPIGSLKTHFLLRIARNPNCWFTSIEENMSGRFLSQLEYSRNPRVVSSMKNGRANFGVQQCAMAKHRLKDNRISWQGWWNIKQKGAQTIKIGLYFLPWKWI